MSPFTPKGQRALRVIIARLAAERPYGTVISYSELATALGLPDDDKGRPQIRQAVSAARNILLKDHSKTLTAERGKGYRVALPGEFAGIAQDHRSRADRQIGKALDIIDHAPVSQMTPDERERHRAVGVLIHNLHSRMTSAEQRLADLEAAVYGPGPRTIQGEVEKNLAQLSPAKHSQV